MHTPAFSPPHLRAVRAAPAASRAARRSARRCRCREGGPHGDRGRPPPAPATPAASAERPARLRRRCSRRPRTLGHCGRGPTSRKKLRRPCRSLPALAPGRAGAGPRGPLPQGPRRPWGTLRLGARRGCPPSAAPPPSAHRRQWGRRRGWRTGSPGRAGTKTCGAAPWARQESRQRPSPRVEGSGQSLQRSRLLPQDGRWELHQSLPRPRGRAVSGGLARVGAGSWGAAAVPAWPSPPLARSQATLGPRQRRWRTHTRPPRRGWWSAATAASAAVSPEA